MFAVASTVTPVFFGMSAGAVASGQIRLVGGLPVSDTWRTWLAPLPLAIGLLALATCAYLAAVYLTLETTGELREDFRRRALGAGAVFAVLAALALVLARSGAPWIWHGLTSRAAVVAVPLGIGLALSPGGRSSRAAFAWLGRPPPPRWGCCWPGGRWRSTPIWSSRT